MQLGSPSESIPDWISARGIPASTSAPSVMSPLMPLKQSRYAIFIVCLLALDLLFIARQFNITGWFDSDRLPAAKQSRC
jgi:hypothetical protein